MKTTPSHKYGLAGYLQFHEIQKPRYKNLLIFRTDIKTKKNVSDVKLIFNNHPVITNWSIDTEDIDNVLRIETADELMAKDIIIRIRTCGFDFELLTN